MANVQPYEIVAGPAEVYFGPVGTPFPAIDAEPNATGGSAWVHVGYTEGGVKVGHPQTVVELRADQTTGVVKAIRSEEGLEITFDIASLTLENYAVVLNRAVTGPDEGSGNASLPLYRGGSQVETFALLVRNSHLSPYGDKALQYEVPAVFHADTPEADYTKDNKAVLSCSLHAIVDPNRADDTESFGRLRAGK
jgi:hypothetical protein